MAYITKRDLVKISLCFIFLVNPSIKIQVILFLHSLTEALPSHFNRSNKITYKKWKARSDRLTLLRLKKHDDNSLPTWI